MSDCVCIYDSGDGDSPAFFTAGFVKARKPHKCCECQAVIADGESYERASGKWEYGVDVYTTCGPCQDIRQSFYCDGYTFGQLWEDVEEQMFQERGLDGACLDKLTTVDAKQFLQRRWWDWVQERTS